MTADLRRAASTTYLGIEANKPSTVKLERPSYLTLPYLPPHQSSQNFTTQSSTSLPTNAKIRLLPIHPSALVHDAEQCHETISPLKQQVKILNISSVFLWNELARTRNRVELGKDPQMYLIPLRNPRTGAEVPSRPKTLQEISNSGLEIRRDASSFWGVWMFRCRMRCS